MVEYSFTNSVVVSSNPVAVIEIFFLSDLLMEKLQIKDFKGKELERKNIRGPG